MNNQLQIFNYNNMPITFQMGNGDVMVNATEMANQFGKRPAKWLELPTTKDFLSTLAAIRKSDRLVESVNGIGTWFHEDVALEFSRWLNPAFAIWCNDRIKELMRHGFTATPDTIERMLDDPDTVIQLLTNIKQERAKRMEAEKQMAHLLPKAALMDKIMDSDQKIDIGQAAKILQLPFGRNTLFNKLREKGVFFKNRNEPKQEHIDRGYFELKEKWIDRDNHDGFMVVKVLVTQKGLDYIARLFEVIPTTKALAKLA